MQVRFPDGTIRYGIYDGTSDVAKMPLFGSSQAAWEWTRFGDPEVEEREGSMWSVEIATDYGFGFRWEGKALAADALSWSRLCLRSLHPYEDPLYDTMEEGLPRWWISP